MNQILHQKTLPAWNRMTHRIMWEELMKRFFFFFKSISNIHEHCGLAQSYHKRQRKIKFKTGVTPLLIEKQSFWLLRVIPANALKTRSCLSF